MAKLPKKGDFRQRAHANPFSDHGEIEYPSSPDQMNWSSLYPELASPPSTIDMGCGYGGLLVALAPLFPQESILGLEIRHKVVDYVHQRIQALRVNSSPSPACGQPAPGSYRNIAVLRVNAMKHLCNYVSKAQLSRLFILFPDPHFKRKKHKARIVTSTLLSEYAYCLRPHGRLYIATDVPELFAWMTSCLDRFPLFRRLAADQLADDPCVALIISRTEESFKVDREGRSSSKQFAVYSRIEIK